MKLPVNYNEILPKERRVVRNEYIRLQNGLCAYCGEPLSGKPRKDIADKKVNVYLFPPNMFMHSIHLHHNHETGMTIGAVHCHCNAVAWQYDGE